MGFSRIFIIHIIEKVVENQRIIFRITIGIPMFDCPTSLYIDELSFRRLID